MPDDETAMAIAEWLNRFLDDPFLVGHLKGHLAILEKGRVRFRPAVEPNE